MVIINERFEWGGRHYDLLFDFRGSYGNIISFYMKARQLEKVLGYSLLFLKDDPKCADDDNYLSGVSIDRFLDEKKDKSELEKKLLKFIHSVIVTKHTGGYQVRGKDVEIKSLKDFYKQEEGWYVVTDTVIEETRKAGKFAGPIPRNAKSDKVKSHIVQVTSKKPTSQYVCPKCK